METLCLNALRFGFSTKDALKIEKLGLNKYISNQLNAKNVTIVFRTETSIWNI